MKRLFLIFLILLMAVFPAVAFAQSPTEESEIEGESPAVVSAEDVTVNPPATVIENEVPAPVSTWQYVLNLVLAGGLLVALYFLSQSFPPGTFDKITAYGETRAKQSIEFLKERASATPSPLDDLVIELGEQVLESDWRAWLKSGKGVYVSDNPNEIADALLNGAKNVLIPPGTNVSAMLDIYNTKLIQSRSREIPRY